MTAVEKPKAKVKQESKEVVKKPAKKAPNRSGTHIDSAAVCALLAKIKKMLGAPENIIVTIDKDVSITASYASAYISVRDNALIEDSAPEKPRQFMLPFVVLANALKGRGIVTIDNDLSCLRLTGSRYKAELNIERAPDMKESNPIKGTDSRPMQHMLRECSALLQITNIIEGAPIDIHFKWGEGQIVGAAADRYHAVIVRGEVKTKNPHQLSLPLDLATKLVEIGGTFEIGETQVTASSEVGRLELSQVNQNSSTISLNSIVNLLNNKPLWKAEFNASELTAVIDNMAAVLEVGQCIEVAATDTTMTLSSNGRYGTVSGVVEIRTLKGKPPEKLNVHNAIFSSIANKLSGPSTFSLLDNMVRLEPSKQKEWEFFGFVVLVNPDAM